MISANEKCSPAFLRKVEPRLPVALALGEAGRPKLRRQEKRLGKLGQFLTAAGTDNFYLAAELRP
jgi:hypothetical protein